MGKKSKNTDEVSFLENKGTEKNPDNCSVGKTKWKDRHDGAIERPGRWTFGYGCSPSSGDTW